MGTIWDNFIGIKSKREIAVQTENRERGRILIESGSEIEIMVKIGNLSCLMLRYFSSSEDFRRDDVFIMAAPRAAAAAAERPLCFCETEARQKRESPGAGLFVNITYCISVI
ncbi:hypothetical protein EVAR_36069_1 [Eumeta japonica]|uniref:Uncharacterized protein n=1 Tax=Eumeta variegata TaxID=151549 RepID=A0A4C1ZAT3_EUMVA|nr:hypothetical protein EVAR_36069_1 [Eumeta japonica]